MQVGDKNVELGYLEKDTLGNLHGAGITVGGPGGAILTRPELVYDSSANAWKPNIDIFAQTGTEFAKLSVDGYLMSSNTATANAFTKVSATSVNFGDKWRFQHDLVNDTIELQHYEINSWVPKFTYTA